MTICTAMELLAKSVRQSNNAGSRVTWFDQKGYLVGEGEFGSYALVRIYNSDQSEPLAEFSHAEARKLRHLGRSSNRSPLEAVPVSRGAGLAIAVIWLVAGCLVIAEFAIFFNGMNSLGQKALMNAEWFEILGIIVLAAIPLQMAVSGTKMVISQDK